MERSLRFIVDLKKEGENSIIVFSQCVWFFFFFKVLCIHVGKDPDAGKD